MTTPQTPRRGQTFTHLRSLDLNWRPSPGQLYGGGTGLGGAASCYVGTFPVIDDLREGRYEIVSRDIYTDPDYADAREIW